MTPEIVQLYHTARKARAEKIIARPEAYKVCDQCNGISFVEARVCENCHAYRWRSTATDVRMVARLNSLIPFPVTFAVVPRTP